MSAAQRSRIEMANVTSLTLRFTLRSEKGDASYHSLVRLLALCPRLRCLDLSRNRMTDAQLKIIAKALSKLSQLQSLRFE